ncbi:MAG: hypothetical protein J6S28_08205 [Clostridia bacterium]|nr:hypothetical protein [Clostridia bacterium]
MNGDLLAYAHDHAHAPAENVQQNLAELQKRQSTLHRARAFWLGELLADKDADIPLSLDELGTLLEQLGDAEQPQDCYAAAVQHADPVALCTEIARRFPAFYEQAFAELFGAHQSPSPEAQGRVAYVANSYTEQAFLELTGFIKERRVAYFHGFEDVCQEVRNGLCEYGILPVESTADGIMAGLLRLIELYDLRICALCHVSTQQGGSTAFALVRATLPVLQPTSGHCIDVLFSPALPSDAGSLITAASLCSHSLTHTWSYTGQDGELIRMRFALTPDTFYPFLWYLLLFCADLTPIGFYTVKNTNK